MPVQINEMVIRAHVKEPGEKSEKTKKAASAPQGAAMDKEEIIKECIEAVLELLSRKNER
jgi:hypothetical protein